jgi:hypothetical protein
LEHAQEYFLGRFLCIVGIAKHPFAQVEDAAVV